MRNYLAGAVLLVGVQAAVANAGVNMNINIGNPPVVVAQAQPRFIINKAPRLIFSPTLGFYVSVGAPYDIVYVGQSYYLNSGGYWYKAPYYDGPWVVVRARKLPRELRKHRFEEIRRYRDVEVRTFERDRDHYRGRWHNPEARRKEERRNTRHEQRHEERRDERRDDRRDEHNGNR